MEGNFKYCWFQQSSKIDRAYLEVLIAKTDSDDLEEFNAVKVDKL